jgi:hypothetical protein
MQKADNVLCVKWVTPETIKAIDHLLFNGYSIFAMADTWAWLAPTGREPSDEDLSAIRILSDELNFDGLSHE